MNQTPSATIGHSHPVFIIAEAGVNHNGQLALAHRLIDVGADAGADAVKFQTFSAEELVTRDAAKAEYQVRTTGDGGQLEMLKRLELPLSAWGELRAHCLERGLHFLSSPFDHASCDLLVDLGVEMLKLGSGELTNRPLIEHCARTGLPLIVSTGMATRNEVGAALSWFRTAFRGGLPKPGGSSKPERGITFEGGGLIALMHCVSSYPAAHADLNIRAVATMRGLFDVPVGFSDHSEGIMAPGIAVSVGACMIEKHFTTDRSLEGPDHAASLEPEELAAMVKAIRQIEVLLGDGNKQPRPCEANTREVARKSICSAIAIKRGEQLTPRHLVMRRPGTGIPPAYLDQLLGKKSLVDIPADTLIRKAWIEGLEADRF